MNMEQQSIFIDTREMQREFFYDGVQMVRAAIEYPVFSSRRFQAAARNMNAYYSSKARAAMKYAATSLRQAAIADYQYRKENNFPFHSYELDMNSVVTLNYRCVASLYTDQYEYTGGAHGSVIRTSTSWALRTGRMISLKDLFPHNPQYARQIKQEIKRQISEQIAAGEDVYFDDYEELVEKTFDEEQFFLTNDALVIYFQQYDIAPYSSGLPEFQIPYSKFPMRLPSCR